MGIYSNDIVNCQVSDRGLKHFMRLNQLKELRLGSAEDNKFTINGFREVLKALKNHRELAILEMKLPDEKVIRAGEKYYNIGCRGLGDKGTGFIVDNLPNLEELYIRNRHSMQTITM